MQHDIAAQTTMCTVYEEVITHYQYDIAKHLFVGPVLLSLLNAQGFLTVSERQDIEYLSTNRGNYRAASVLLDRLKLLSLDDWNEILKVFTKTSTGEHIVEFIQEKRGKYFA